MKNENGDENNNQQTDSQRFVPRTILTVTNLGIRRSERWLFRDLNFELKSGEVIQVVGENGAGKTSLLRSLCGLLPYARGEAKWAEIDESECLPLFLGHLPAVKPELTVFENLKFHPIAGEFATESQIEAAIEEVQLGFYLDTQARYLSAGQVRRVGLARLLIAQTPCWILDEPFTSLDVDGCHWLEGKIDDFAKNGGCVLLTSHQSIHLPTPPKLLELSNAEQFTC
ncbi:cytochrome c biogenesis heme-transporting ATPase CcmA [Aliikangiella coralliicola]|uniref:Cytochrome c biogenesis heme-transporting ATPase CcmA n=1 Tax=Aliikangiella coralliicola TaxID=2592383 RepID=A0A545UAC7_9GAMM|nr:cytochrome c biogenesis heme-transporting ATPase CcmA [Aliikangiella coralliicola]TQV86431.1 cytochrome c biogenesis heme-transporting ATPase CcmA [Aliikangiella coralliicola]